MKGPVQFELVLFECVLGDELGVDGLAIEDGADADLGGVLIHFFIVVEGDVQLLEDAQGGQIEGGHQPGDEDARKRELLGV